LRPKGMVVRSVADGKEAAHAIAASLAGQTGAVGKEFTVRMGKLDAEEVGAMMSGATQTPRMEPVVQTSGYLLDQAVEQAGRCLHCDCRGLSTCKLRHYAALYGADPNHYRGQRAVYRQEMKPSWVVFEPSKCINCGLCIEIVRSAKEPLGLSFVGRGFDVRVGVPFGRSLEEALGKVAAQCIAACPTAALSHREESHSALPILGQR
jgi:predicted molibdopterin-dependent oxidoreductase YjgC